MKGMWRKKFVVSITVFSVLFIAYRGIRMLETSFQRAPPPMNAQISGFNQSLFDMPMLGKLNLDMWKCRQYVGFNVDDMRIQKDWPLHPNERDVSKGLRHTFKTYSNYAFKMYGYLLTSAGGSYYFQIVSRSTAALGVELWMSPSSLPSDVSMLAILEYPEASRGYLSSSMTTDTLAVQLKSGQAYYMELHMKSFDGHGDVEVKWKLPGEKHYHSIPSHSLAMAAKLEGSTFSSEQPNKNIIDSLSKTLPSNELQTHFSYWQFFTDSVLNITDFDILPSCSFHAEYAVPKVVKENTGFFMVDESLIYPGDSTLSFMYLEPQAHGDEGNEKRKRGNLRIPKSTINNIVHLYRQAFLQRRYTGKVLRARYMEETKNNDKGSRFLLEMSILQQGCVKYTSEYVYLASNSHHLCRTSNFQWHRGVDVHLVVTVKNLGPWVRHLIHNLERISATTNDKNFQLIIVDYMSTDLDISAELEDSNIPRWKLLVLDGAFSRSRGLQAGIDYVRDNNSVVMTIDMHLTLPPNFIDAVRKHTVQGKMAYTPMFYRLEPGYTELNPVGSWETWTYGLFGMYKSDWLEHGGFNTQKYTTKWGGEDVDVLDRALAKGYEAFRTRPPGLMHYYHSYDGMWDSRKKLSHYLLAVHALCTKRSC